MNPVTGGSVVKDAVSIDANRLPRPVPGADFIYDYGRGTASGKIWGTSDNVTGAAFPDSQ